MVLAREVRALQIIVLYPSASSASYCQVMAGTTRGCSLGSGEMGDVLLPHLLFLVEGRFSLI